MRPVFLLVLLPLVGVPAMAVEPQVGAELVWTRIKTAGETFNPLAARARLALEVTPEWEIGVMAGQGVRDAGEVGVTVAIDGFHAGYIRHSASLDENARLVLMAGYGAMTLDVAAGTAGIPGTGEYRGVVFGLSLQERLARWPNWTGSLDFERWYDEDGLKIDAIGYGFRYAF